MNRLLFPGLLAVAVALTMFMSAPQSSAEQTCLAWERSIRSAGASDDLGPPALDRLGAEGPQGQLLKDWLADNCMRMNYVQVLGTHNSYHIEPRPPLLAFLYQLAGQVPFPGVEALIDALVYTHRPLDQQLQGFGVRQLELDVFADPEGGLYATPVGALLPFPEPGVTLPISGLVDPGLKVMHIPDLDYKTNCLTFASCLMAIRSWSDANPNHLPVLVLVEAKDEGLPPDLEAFVESTFGIPLVNPLPFGPDELEQIDEEIRNVFSDDRLITPDDVRGNRATLEEAVLKDGWPTLNEARGRVMFALDNEDQKRTDYIDGHPSLTGRVMFTNSAPGTPESAFVEMDEPVGNVAAIQELVALGYLVRTRADDNTVEARLNSIARRDAAIESGAQFVSTDYIEDDPDFDGEYLVEIPGDQAFRCNPVLSPPGCDPSTFEAPAD